MRDLAAKQLAPTDHAQLGAVQEALDRVAAAGSQVVARYGKVLQAANSPSARASKKVAELAGGES